jgi:hypothetical protein
MAAARVAENSSRIVSVRTEVRLTTLYAFKPFYMPGLIQNLGYHALRLTVGGYLAVSA